LITLGSSTMRRTIASYPPADCQLLVSLLVFPAHN
jgi:hypothetical protein